MLLDFSMLPHVRAASKVFLILIQLNIIKVNTCQFFCYKPLGEGNLLLSNLVCTPRLAYKFLKRIRI